MVSEGVLLTCLSGVCVWFRSSMASACSVRSSAGSELEWPTRIWPLRSDTEPKEICEELCEDLPKDLCDELFLPFK